MKFEIYCDESGLEAIADPRAHWYIAIGGIWMIAEHREELKAHINALKEEHKFFWEIKWTKVSERFLPFYKAVIDYFLSATYIRFRIILVESNKINDIHFQQDAELGFYKFYYQLLHHWILDFNHYNIFLDYKMNREKDRLHVLRRVLDYSNLSSEIERVQAIPSEESIFFQEQEQNGYFG